MLKIKQKTEIEKLNLNKTVSFWAKMVFSDIKTDTVMP